MSNPISFFSSRVIRTSPTPRPDEISEPPTHSTPQLYHRGRVNTSGEEEVKIVRSVSPEWAAMTDE